MENINLTAKNLQNDIYFDAFIAGVDVKKLETQITTVIAGAFGLFLSVQELLNTFHTMKDSQSGE